MDFALHKSIAGRILKHAEEEIADIESTDVAHEVKLAQRYRVMQLAFDDVIDESKSYKDILKTVKTSYDDYLKYLEDSNNSSVTLSSKLKNVAARPTTLANLKKRGDQLEENLHRLRAQNEYLKEEFLSLDFELDHDQNYTFDNQTSSGLIRDPRKKVTRRPASPVNENSRALFDHLGVNDTLDEDKLRECLKTLTEKLNTLKQQKDEKFIKKSRHDECWTEYSKKSEQKTLLENTYFDLQKELYLISVANDAAKAYNEKQPLGRTIAEYVYDSLVDAFKLSMQHSQTEDDPLKLFGDSEASAIINHVEHFHILFDEGRFEQAAWHAAKSPKGVLRNLETFRKFKEAQEIHPEKPIMHCLAHAFMSTLEDFSSRVLNEEMSMEFVRAMVKAGEQKLVYQWFQNGWISTSKQVADLLACDKHSRIHGTVVAETIYMRLGMYHDAIRCMAFRGDIPAAISFAQDTAGFKREDYIDLLLSVPSVKLARALAVQKYPGTNKVLLPCGQIALLLLKDIFIDIAAEFLKGLDLTPPVVRSTGDEGDKVEVAPNCIFSDKETSVEDWFHIVKQLEHTVYEDLGTEIVTALYLNDALSKASQQLSS